MDVADLIEALRREAAHTVPLVGAGMALDAGAPPVSVLATELIDRFGLGDPSLDLGAASAAAVASSGLAAVQVAIAELVARTRPRPTAALTALASAPGGVILTTNYDDAIEEAARRRGTTPITLALTDNLILEQPGKDEVHVVHLHGVVERPETIILPGDQMEQLKTEEKFQRLLTGLLAPRSVLCLGFELGESEVHLREQLEWLADQLQAPRRHWLLLGASRVKTRVHDLVALAQSGNVEVIAYDDSEGHAAVTQVAQALAPRSYDRAADPTVDARLTWVHPILMTQAPGETLEQLERQVSSFDFTGTSTGIIASPADLRSHLRTVIVAAPGMGKSKLVAWLPSLLKVRSVVGSLRDFRADETTDLIRDILRLLRNPKTNEPVTLEEWQGPPLTVILDGLDELSTTLQAEAVKALMALASGLPEHRLIVTSRPVQAVDELSAQGFQLARILPSQRWAEKYLQTRALTEPQISQALRSQPLGDLVAVPLFAELVADRLLDAPTGAFDALDLLASSQLDAVKREAARAVVLWEPLGCWLRSLAVGLQLTNKESVPVADLNPPPTMLPLAEALERLRLASVLGDQPGKAAFTRRTLQEAVVADSIINHPSPVKAFLWTATAEVQGQQTIRADLDFVADLVFEHAPSQLREQLRDLDEERWARTVVSRGTLEDGREAFNFLERWHRDHHVTYVSSVRRSLLRSPDRAITAICQRWPEIVNRRRGRLIRELGAGSDEVRLRALTVLGAIPPDPVTCALLADVVRDPSRLIAMRAADIAGRHQVDTAIPALKENLKSNDGGVRISAMRALFDVVPEGRLQEIGRLLGPQGPPAPIAEDLDRRLNLDDGLAFLQSLTSRSGTTAWLIDRLVETTPPFAWTESRAIRLFAVLRISGQADPDFEPIAIKLMPHLHAVLQSVRPTPNASTSGGWYLPIAQAQVLLAVDHDALLTAEATPELLSALENAQAELAGWNSPATREEQRADLEALIDESPVNFDRMAGSASFRDIDEGHKKRLADAVAAAWPADAIEAGELWPDNSVVHVGCEAAVVISTEHWCQLLRAHAGAPGGYRLGGDRITRWLTVTRPPNASAAVIPLIADASTGNQLLCLSIIGGLEDHDLAAAAATRVCELDVHVPGWVSAAAHILEHVMDTGLILDCAGQFRDGLIGLLARNGNRDAQKEMLASFTEQARNGEIPNPPNWLNPEFDDSFVEPLLRLAHELGDTSGLLSFTVTNLGRIDSALSASALTKLASERSDLWWVRLEADAAAARQATKKALLNLPAAVLDAAAAFQNL